jgi:hypothetical protein
MQIRSSKKIQSEVSLQDPIGVDRDGNEITLIDVIGDTSESVVDEVDLKMQVIRLYNKMKSVLKNRESCAGTKIRSFKRGKQDPAGSCQYAGYIQVICIGTRL